MKVGYLGPKATFTELAVKKVFQGYEHEPYQTIPASMDAIVDKEVELAVVPIENALEGSVNITLDYLTQEVQIPIIGEITLPIKQHLMVHPDNQENWQDVSKVYSHSHAIAQCHKFLHNHLKGVPLPLMPLPLLMIRFEMGHHLNGYVEIYGIGQSHGSGYTPY